MIRVLLLLMLIHGNLLALDPYKLEPLEPFDEEYDKSGGQKITPTDERPPFHTDGFFFVPLYSRVNGGASAMGFTGAYYFHRYGEHPVTLPCYFRTALLFGGDQYIDANFIFDNYWNSDFVNFFNSMYIRNSDVPYYETGVDIQQEPQYSGAYHETVFGINSLYRMKFSKSGYWGIKYNFEYSRLTGFSGGGRLSGLGISISNLRVDNIFAPRDGTFYELTNMFYLKYFGSSSDFGEHIVDAREYNVFWKTHLLALQFYLISITGNQPPFTRLARIGKILRAYPSELYVDRHAIALKGEYRILLIPRVVVVAFLELGYSAATIHEFRLNNHLYSYGGGLRYLIYKPLDINMRLDYAIGRNSKVLLIGIGEAF
ncbi:MAG: hypothetical protein JXA66_09130 [Oligoflexia bacterium]|nr:hypothetical protein [Oligoflexia bacterium]